MGSYDEIMEGRKSKGGKPLDRKPRRSRGEIIQQKAIDTRQGQMDHDARHLLGDELEHVSVAKPLMLEDTHVVPHPEGHEGPVRNQLHFQQWCLNPKCGHVFLDELMRCPGCGKPIKANSPVDALMVKLERVERQLKGAFLAIRRLEERVGRLE